MNDSKSWAQGSRYYEQLWVVVDMNDYNSWAHASNMNKPRVVIDLRDSGLWAQGSRCYEQLGAMVDMNDFESGSQGFRSYE